ncbi:hypothetical protein ABW19_dt0210348 [Dactylella cylindrospora]|nr:hypothetical protein ABW19_dt0210348 [Dactylella cylindrospora]
MATMSPSVEPKKTELEERKEKTSVLIEYLTNTLAYGLTVDSREHNNYSQRLWIHGQIPPMKYLRHVRKDPLWEDVALGVKFYGSFLFLLDRSSPEGDPPGSPINLEYLKYAIRNLIFAIESIQHVEQEYLQENSEFVQGVLNAAVYSFDVFSFSEWAILMNDSRVPNNPVRTFLNWFQPRLERSEIRTFKDWYVKMFEPDMKGRKGKFENNQFYYTPHVIPDRNGNAIMNLGLFYVTAEDESEKKQRDQYNRRMDWLKRNPDAAAKALQEIEKIEKKKISRHQQYYQRLQYHCAVRSRGQQTVRVWHRLQPFSSENTSPNSTTHSPDSNSSPPEISDRTVIITCRTIKHAHNVYALDESITDRESYCVPNAELPEIGIESSLDTDIMED